MNFQIVIIAVVILAALGSGDHLNIDIPIGKGLEHFCSNPRIADHSSADNGNLSHCLITGYAAGRHHFHIVIQNIQRFRQIRSCHSKGNIFRSFPSH